MENQMFMNVFVCVSLANNPPWSRPVWNCLRQVLCGVLGMLQQGMLWYGALWYGKVRWS